jgi:acyl-coenzyme A synthetase/AMP-(fatty) acid ligase
VTGRMGEHIGRLAGRAAERWPDAMFGILDDEQLTFARLAAWVETATEGMRDTGVVAGDTVLVHLPPPSTAGVDECCLILYTSGTTSAPKGARLTSRALAAALDPWVEIGITGDDVALAVAPLAHIAGLNAGALLPLTVGCRAVIMRKWDPDGAIRLIDTHGATVSCGAAVFLQDLVDRYETCAPEVHTTVGWSTPSASGSSTTRVASSHPMPREACASAVRSCRSDTPTRTPRSGSCTTAGSTRVTSPRSPRTDGY